MGTQMDNCQNTNTGHNSSHHRSNAFDTIQRDRLIDIENEILNEDEIRILRVLLAETTLDV